MHMRQIYSKPSFSTRSLVGVPLSLRPFLVDETKAADGLFQAILKEEYRNLEDHSCVEAYLEYLKFLKLSGNIKAAVALA